LISSARRRLSHLGSAVVVEWEKGFSGRGGRLTWAFGMGRAYPVFDFLTCLLDLSQLLGQNNSRPEFKRSVSAKFHISFDTVSVFLLTIYYILHCQSQRLKCHYIAHVPIINSSCITRTIMQHQKSQPHRTLAPANEKLVSLKSSSL
jgi:hypothetical protein